MRARATTILKRKYKLNINESIEDKNTNKFNNK